MASGIGPKINGLRHTMHPCHQFGILVGIDFLSKYAIDAFPAYLTCFFASSTMDLMQHPLASRSAPARYIRVNSALPSCSTYVTPVRSTINRRPAADCSESRQHCSSSSIYVTTRRPPRVILVESSDLWVVIFIMV